MQQAQRETQSVSLFFFFKGLGKGLVIFLRLDLEDLFIDPQRYNSKGKNRQRPPDSFQTLL